LCYTGRCLYPIKATGDEKNKQRYHIASTAACRISNCRNRNRNRNLVGMQVTNYKGKIPSKERENKVRLNCFLGLFCIGIWLQRKISYRFPSMYSYESNAPTVQLPIGTGILYFSFKIPMNQRRPKRGCTNKTFKMVRLTQTQ
jgi:hypothetical protein